MTTITASMVIMMVVIITTVVVMMIMIFINQGAHISEEFFNEALVRGWWMNT